eukprot:TRINITY_DN52956_c0_g1_i1.p1 TRINITY_DN52956_c0_g1~~TRINITY_DN52956_c0_g1_i1.p1  ORF type:complete len:365 (+),score=54.82 TRINITY_DN52956_c0_g1_i1:29-1096(+)
MVSQVFSSRLWLRQNSQRCLRWFSSASGLNAVSLNGSFGALVEANLSPVELRRPEVGAELRQIWLRSGVLALRGLAAMTPEDLVAISAHFGPVSDDVGAARKHATIPGLPVLRIGNIRDSKGHLISVPPSSKNPRSQLPETGSCQYRPDERLPVWHTDGTFAATPPAGSAFFCQKAPAKGAQTCFADTVGFWARDLSSTERSHLETLECICSQAHHDAKLNKANPDYPTMTAEQRAQTPPRRVPVALDHPVTGRRALYGMNSSTCRVLPKGDPVSAAEMDRFDLEAFEDPSVSILRDLLPRVTKPEYSIVWNWQPGDLLVWDNRSTIHCGTGYDQEKYVREMWRTTILPKANENI